MDNLDLYLIIIFVIILIIFYFFNRILNKEIEKYGIYCGRYNLNKGTALQNCNNDSECLWNNYTSLAGIPAGWCGQNIPPPPPPTPPITYTSEEDDTLNSFFNSF